MIEKIKLIGFKLLLVAALFSITVNIAYAEDNTKDDPPVEKVQVPVTLHAPQDIQDIFTMLQFTAGKSANKIQLWLYTSNVVNAHMDDSANLVIYAGILNFIMRDRNDKDMLAGIMAHEIGHWTLGHVRDSSTCFDTALNTRNCEREADIYSVKLMTDAGYDCHHASKFFTDIIKTWGSINLKNESTHPSDRERETYIEKACTIYKETGISMDVPYEAKVPESSSTTTNVDE